MYYNVNGPHARMGWGIKFRVGFRFKNDAGKKWMSQKRTIRKRLILANKLNSYITVN